MPKKGAQPKLQFSSITECALAYKPNQLATTPTPSFPLQLHASRIKISAPEIWSEAVSAAAADFQQYLIRLFFNYLR